MDVSIEPLITGWLTLDKSLLLPNESGRIRIPIPAFLVKHPKGNLVFDSGLHPEIGIDPNLRLKDSSGYEFENVTDIAKLLHAKSIDPKSIRYLVNSHLHFDHCGGNALLPDAQIVIQKTEWEAAQIPEFQEAVGYATHDFDTGQDVKTVDGELDLFSDQTVTCIPTPGHTPGHQSLRVQTKEKTIVLMSDACYLKESLDQKIVPKFFHDENDTLKSMEILTRLRHEGCCMVAGHDKRCFNGNQLVGI